MAGRWSLTLPGAMYGTSITITLVADANPHDSLVTVEVVGLPLGGETLGTVVARVPMTIDELRAIVRIASEWPGVARG